MRGHVLYVDSPWALSSISQAQVWSNREFSRDYDDGTARECMSIDISDFNEPGTLFGQPARLLAPEKIVRGAWQQMKAHLNDTGTEVLSDDLILSWYMDPALVFARHVCCATTTRCSSARREHGPTARIRPPRSATCSWPPITYG